jgi:hypothetical protein
MGGVGSGIWQCEVGTALSHRFGPARGYVAADFRLPSDHDQLGGREDVPERVELTGGFEVFAAPELIFDLRATATHEAATTQESGAKVDPRTGIGLEGALWMPMNRRAALMLTGGVSQRMPYDIVYASGPVEVRDEIDWHVGAGIQVILGD